MVRFFRRKSRDEDDDAFADADERDPNGGPIGFDSTSATSPIVPARSVAGRALLFVIAIMTFLSCLTVGAVTLVNAAAGDWQSDISREITIQIRPVDGQDMLAKLDDAVRIAEAQPGVASASALSVADTNALLEPWLGSDLDLGELPVPRLVVVTLGDPALLDIAAFRAALSASVPTATVDDHSTWSGQLASVARTVVIGGFSIVALMLIALALSIVFATRAAIASNVQVIEVLHFVGAENAFVAREFQKHFLLKGLIGGLLGGGSAVAVFVAIEIAAGSARGTAAVAQAQALLGPLTIGLPGYIAALAIVFAVAILTALTSRIAVHRHLTHLD
ncbi:cell division transport system permease protein [Amorphus suaedae]